MAHGRFLATTGASVVRCADEKEVPGNAVSACHSSLRFGWIPARLLFVTQGPPPYTLAFGNGAVEPAGFSARELFQPMSADFAAIKDMPLASTGELATLGGKKRLERTREVKWQQFALWGSMILGVLVLGTLAVRLLRSLPEDNQTES